MNIHNAKNNFKISIAAFLVLLMLFSIAGSLLAPKKPAKAIISTLPLQIIEYIMEIINWYQDYSEQTSQSDSLEEIEEMWDWYKDDILDRRDQRESWNEERKDMLDELVNDIIDNMQDMGDGFPAFIDDWETHLYSKTYGYFDNFVQNDLNQADMCDTFQSEVQQEISAGNEPPYGRQAQCPSNYNPDSLLARNSQNFWSDWLAMLQPSGNPFGAYMISADEKMEREGLGYTSEIFKLAGNQGFRGDEETPGILQAYAAQRASMMDLDYLLNSDELETYFGSVADAFINQILDQGLLDFEFNPDPINNPPPAYPPVVSDPEQWASYVQANIGSMATLRDRFGLLIENLNIMISEINANIALLNQIQAQQANCGLSTANSTAEINILTAAALAAQTQITQIQNAIAALDALMPVMNQVMAAEMADDDVALAAATAAFVPAQAQLLNIVNTITGEVASDINDILEDVSDYNSEVINNTAQYPARRGTGQEPWIMPQYLYGWLARLNFICQD